MLMALAKTLHFGFYYTNETIQMNLMFLFFSCTSFWQVAQKLKTIAKCEHCMCQNHKAHGAQPLIEFAAP